MSGAAQSSQRGMSQNESRWRGYLDAMRAGESQALAQFYDETSSAIFGLALRVLINRADAEEVVLDVYQQFWSSRHTFNPDRGTVWAWITTLTRSRAIDRLRSAGSRRGREFPFEPGWETASHTPEPEQQTIFQQERKLVQQSLQSLTPDQRQAIELCFFAGLTHIEVADCLGVPLGTIKTRIRVGVRRLRDVLGPLSSAEGAH